MRCRFPNCFEQIRLIVDHSKEGVWLKYEPGPLKAKRKKEKDEGEPSPSLVFFHLSEPASDGLCYFHFKKKIGLFDWVPLNRREVKTPLFNQEIRDAYRRKGGGWKL